MTIDLGTACARTSGRRHYAVRENGVVMLACKTAGTVRGRNFIHDDGDRGNINCVTCLNYGARVSR